MTSSTLPISRSSAARREAADSSGRAAELAAALGREMAGEVDSSNLTRGLYSTDASNYRVVPQVVAFPENAEDVSVALALASSHEVPITARGAGTSIAGNAVGAGLVLDFAKHMNQVEIDPGTQSAIVGPGAILGAIQRAAAPHGLRFGPDPSTWPRATIGGTIGNNACGPRALAYGRAADNVIELDAIDGTGRLFTAAQDLAAVQGLADLVNGNLGTIRPNFGRFKRQVSGYSLEHLLPEHGTDLARFLSGSEGSLALFTRARVNLVPQAPAPALVVLGYPSMADAADAVPALLAHAPLAIEGIDHRLIDVVRAHSRTPVPSLPDGAGWLLVEVGGENDSEALARARALASDGGTSSFIVLPAGPEAAALWRIRADGAGLGGRTPAGRPAWPGFEDAAVPPEKLGAYLRDFESLLADHNLDGLLYGHFGDGCIHVRIDFPIESVEGVPSTMAFLEEATDLVVSYGGSISGEHGDGRARGALLERMYPAEARDLFGQVKHLLDPDNNLNPGIVAAPVPVAADLRRPAARITEARGFAFREDGGDFTNAVHRCTGVAKCQQDNSAAGGFMCPSFLASREEKDGTRGRARILQEVTNGTLITKWGSEEVRDALDLCLACKACSTDCPTGVDIAKYRSETQYRAYYGKVRPITHYLLGQLPRWAGMVRSIPGVAALVNAVTGLKPVEKAILFVGGMDVRRNMVTFEKNPVGRWMRKRGGKLAGEETEGAPVSGARGQRVVVWADSFSQSLDSGPAKDVVLLLEEAGYDVVLAPEGACCGLTWITTGQLDGAKKRLDKLAGILGPLAVNGIPIVGVEPSCTAVLRDDLLDLLPDDPRAHAIGRQTFTLAELLTHPEYGPGEAWRPADLDGVEVVAQPHCHHYSVMGWEADERLLTEAGAEVTTLTGCCGLAGNFGMERGHYEMSVKVAENNLLPGLNEHPDAVYLADGFSCRTQATQLADRRGIHLATLLRGKR
ncbi:MAG TPA: FAD-binding and (Fe-S)-binding domain-containing protein [Actinomycetaceae bacterium]|nr:FAD-binding and (Fe-S)-binding domain-containing protein [Actinomycetaceae bacterium]